PSRKTSRVRKKDARSLHRQPEYGSPKTVPTNPRTEPAANPPSGCDDRPGASPGSDCIRAEPAGESRDEPGWPFYAFDGQKTGHRESEVRARSARREGGWRGCSYTELAAGGHEES